MLLLLQAGGRLPLVPKAVLDELAGARWRLTACGTKLLLILQKVSGLEVTTLRSSNLCVLCLEKAAAAWEAGKVYHAQHVSMQHKTATSAEICQGHCVH